MNGMRVAEVDGARIRYVEVGEGEPILLLHGYPQSHRCWRKQIPDLARTHRVIAPDWLGWGVSERTLAVAPEFHQEVERLARFADDVVGRPLNLFAHDYGGLIGLGFVQRFPDRVLRFAILNSRAHGTFLPSFRRLTDVQCRLARSSVGRRIFTAMPHGLIHRASLARYVRLGCFDDSLLEEYVGWMQSAAGRRWLAHFYAHYELAPRVELASGLSSVRCPTAVVWGDRDPFIPFETAEQLASQIPDATLVRLAGADHFVMEERPTDALGALRDLLDRK